MDTGLYNKIHVLYYNVKIILNFGQCSALWFFQGVWVHQMTDFRFAAQPKRRQISELIRVY